MKLTIASLLVLAETALGLTCQQNDPKHYSDITQTFNTSDVLQIINSFNTNTFVFNTASNFTDPVHIPKATGFVVDFLTARVCVYNANLFFSTYGHFSDITYAIQLFLDTCCTDSTGSCWGGSTGFHRFSPSEGVNICIQSSEDGIDNCLASNSISNTVLSWSVAGGAVVGAEIGALALSTYGEFAEAEAARIARVLRAESRVALDLGGPGALSMVQALRQGFPIQPRPLLAAVRWAFGATEEDLAEADWATDVAAEREFNWAISMFESEMTPQELSTFASAVEKATLAAEEAATEFENGFDF